MRREKSLRIGVHHADAVVWEPVYRTHLRRTRRRKASRRRRLVDDVLDGRLASRFTLRAHSVSLRRGAVLEKHRSALRGADVSVHRARDAARDPGIRRRERDLAEIPFGARGITW